jgi:cytochrome P450 / NADPH-cytochrome P450 reductase
MPPTVPHPATADAVPAPPSATASAPGTVPVVDISATGPGSTPIQPRPWT